MLPTTVPEMIRAAVQIVVLTVFFYSTYIALAQNRASRIIGSILTLSLIHI